MSIKLSVLVPGIRSHRWRELYDSIKSSCSRSWEMVIIGPFEPSEDLMSEGNVKYIKDFGTPIRCQQIGLLQAEGDYITWAADDGQFFPKSLDVSFDMLDGFESSQKDETPVRDKLVMGKYYEGYSGHVSGAMAHMADDWYYNLLNHDCNKKLNNLPSPAWMLNVGVVSRELLLEVGGWDCQFEVCPCSYNDLAIRLQKHNVDFIIQNEMMYHCGHMPVRSGDHGPIHDAQTQHDEPLFRSIYLDGSSKDRVLIDVNNWQNSPEKWHRRFGSSEEKNPESYSDLPFDNNSYRW